MSAESILDHLRRDGTALSSQVLGEMYAEDSFWTERYGARGRQNADRDGAYHVTYLIEAVAADDPQLFVKYARWLRELLCGRGMASRHLIENLDRLAAALAARSWNGVGRAVAILGAGSGALVHREGQAGAVESRRAAWVASLAAELERHAPRRMPAPGGRPHWTVDADLYVWYLADALGLGLPSGFASTLFETHLAAVRMFEASSGYPSVVPVVTRHLAGVARDAGLSGRALAMLAAAESPGAPPA